MSGRVFYGAIFLLVAMAAVNSKAADVNCKIVPTPPPVDCSTGTSLKRGWTPHVCRVA